MASCVPLPRVFRSAAVRHAGSPVAHSPACLPACLPGVARLARHACLERFRLKKARRGLSGKKVRYQARKDNADKRPRVKVGRLPQRSRQLGWGGLSSSRVPTRPPPVPTRPPSHALPAARCRAASSRRTRRQPSLPRTLLCLPPNSPPSAPRRELRARRRMPCRSSCCYHTRLPHEC